MAKKAKRDPKARRNAAATVGNALGSSYSTRTYTKAADSGGRVRVVQWTRKAKPAYSGDVTLLTAKRMSVHGDTEGDFGSASASASAILAAAPPLPAASARGRKRGGRTA